jgi:hypothetical protein
MKSRVAILGMLVTGILFSTAGAGLALSGGAQNNAAVSQYATPTPTPTPVCTETPSPGNTSPTSSPTPGGSTGSGNAGGNVCEEGGVLPAEETNAPSSGSQPAEAKNNSGGGGVLPAEETNTQPERQAGAAATTSQLPFTGYAAIPVLLGGLILLTGGLLLRRRVTRED